jgi:hypothetical protein
MNAVISIIGAVLFIYRIWIVEIRLKDILAHRKCYISRITNYFYFIAMILNFESDIFNLIIVSALPVIIIGVFINDIPAYINFKKDYVNENGKTKFLILLEGVSLHPPIIITGVIFYVTNLKIVFSSLVPMSLNSGVIFASVYLLGFLPLILFDIRWKERKPVAKWMLFGGTASFIWVMVYIWLI